MQAATGCSEFQGFKPVTAMRLGSSVSAPQKLTAIRGTQTARAVRGHGTLLRYACNELLKLQMDGGACRWVAQPCFCCICRLATSR